MAAELSFRGLGEGTLMNVLLVPGEQDVARHLTLEVDHLGNMFNGVLFAKDRKEPDVIYRLYTALRNCLNQGPSRRRKRRGRPLISGQ